MEISGSQRNCSDMADYRIGNGSVHNNVDDDDIDRVCHG